MRAVFAALVSGLLFGLGLTVSQMINPAKVIGFLDLSAIGTQASPWSWRRPSP
jgi:uncharacterized protein